MTKFLFVFFPIMFAACSVSPSAEEETESVQTNPVLCTWMVDCRPESTRPGGCAPLPIPPCVGPIPSKGVTCHSTEFDDQVFYCQTNMVEIQ